MRSQLIRHVAIFNYQKDDTLNFERIIPRNDKIDNLVETLAHYLTPNSGLDNINFTINFENGTLFCFANSRKAALQGPKLTKVFLVITEIPATKSLKLKATTIFESLIKSPSLNDYEEDFKLSLGELNVHFNESIRKVKNFDEEIYSDCNIVDTILSYEENVLVIFKAILLERRIILGGTTPNGISNTIYSLVSLFPKVLKCGLLSRDNDGSWMENLYSWPFLTRLLGDDENLAKYISHPNGESSTKIFVKDRTFWNDTIEKNSEISDRSLEDMKNILADAPMEFFDTTKVNTFLTDDCGFPLSIFAKDYRFIPFVPSLQRFSQKKEKLLARKVYLNKFDRFKNEPLEKVIVEHILTGNQLRGFIAGVVDVASLKSDDYDVFLSPVESVMDKINKKNCLKVLSGKTLPKRARSGDRGSIINKSSLLDGDINLEKSNYEIEKVKPDHATLVIRHRYTNYQNFETDLSELLELSSMDKMFMNRIILTCKIWTRMNVMKKSSPSEELEIEKEISEKFTEKHDLEKWIREKFSQYLLSLLLTTKFENQSNPSDFNDDYVSALRDTRLYAIWSETPLKKIADYHPKKESDSVESKHSNSREIDHPGKEFLEESNDIATMKKRFSMKTDSRRRSISASLSRFIKSNMEKFDKSMNE